MTAVNLLLQINKIINCLFTISALILVSLLKYIIVHLVIMTSISYCVNAQNKILCNTVEFNCDSDFNIAQH